jgi:hypothetical protein
MQNVANTTLESKNEVLVSKGKTNKIEPIVARSAIKTICSFQVKESAPFLLQRIPSLMPEIQA